MNSSTLLTDAYELTMLRGYFESGMEAEAVFELFVRNRPHERNFLIAAGLEQLLSFLEGLHFEPDELAWLAQDGRFPIQFIRYLERLRFTGDVDAMPEGTVFFENEPIVRVTAPLPQAQLIETRLINLIHFQTLVASKAVRSVLAAKGKQLVDFGLRRAHGSEAGLYSARASFLAGFSGTSTVLAGREFGIPLYGTMAHSFIEAHEDEVEAFKTFARANPENVVLLLDTYDTEMAARKLAHLAPTLKHEGISIRGVRLDSGDLAAHARAVRSILDEGGLNSTHIFVSGSLDEYQVERLAADAPINGFGVGTQMNTSADFPYLDCAYKIQEYNGKPRRKLSESKETLPGRKQVFRQFDEKGCFAFDLLTLDDDAQDGTPLLKPVMRAGQRVGDAPSLSDSRCRAAEEIERLPAKYRQLQPTKLEPVQVSAALQNLARGLELLYR